MAAYPYARVGHLLDMEYPTYGTYSHRSTTTPTTISGNDRAVSSYALCIGFADRDGRGWWVYDRKSSPTTNRHIGALKAVLEHNGFEPTDETRVDRGGWDRTYPYRLFAKAQPPLPKEHAAMIATYLGPVNPDNDVASQHLYRLDPPLFQDRSWLVDDGEEDTESRHWTYVVASEACVSYSGPETYLFGSDEHGVIQDWGELPGSQRGILDHAQAIRNAGYAIMEG